MGAMLRQVIDRFDVLSYPIIALAVFIVVFFSVSVLAFSKRKEEIEHLASLPLIDGKES